MPEKTEIDPFILRVMSEDGIYKNPNENTGKLVRPFGVPNQEGGRLATLQTLYDFFIDVVPDPDTALAQNPDFDEYLTQQPDVLAAMRLRELTVASLPAKIKPSEAPGIDREQAQKIADYVNDVFNALTNRMELYRQMQNAVMMGGQGHEWVWARDGLGIDRPVNYFPIHKTRFVFDRTGNLSILTREYPVWGVVASRNPERMPDGRHIYKATGGKFTYHKYMSHGGPWHRPAAEGYIYWGRGEDTNLYIPVTFDQFVLRFQMKWLEKHGMPTSVLYHPENSELTSQTLKIAESIRDEAVIRIPRPIGPGEENSWFHLEFVDPPASGYEAFSQFHDSWTAPRIEKILLGGANLLNLGESGAYAATVDQRDSGMDIIFRFDAQNINETINTQLIPYIVCAKFKGCDSKYWPKHALEPAEQVDQQVKMSVLQQGAALVPVRKASIYQAMGEKPPGDDEETVFVGMQPDGAFDGFPQNSAAPKKPAGKTDKSTGNKKREPITSKSTRSQSGKKPPPKKSGK